MPSFLAFGAVSDCSRKVDEMKRRQKAISKNISQAPEISWLSFNARVLQEADNHDLSLKERIRFLGIYSNNRDEFFKLKVAALKKKIQLNKNKSIPQLILDQIHVIILQQQKVFNRIWKKIIGELKKEKIFLINDKKLNAKQKMFVRNFYDQEVSSSIIPLFVENIPKLPSIADNAIFLGIVMQKSHPPFAKKFAIIEIPTKNHNRFVSLPSIGGEQNIMLLEDVVRFNLPRIFSHLDYHRFKAYMFKITKDAEIDIDQDLTTTFIEQIRKGVRNRRQALPIRFLYDIKMNKELLKFLISKLHLSHKDSIIPGGDIRNFRDFRDFPAILPDSILHKPPFKHPSLAKALRVSDVVMQKDVLLHLPYHSFNSIIDFLREAAMDPEVKSIKITAYRLAANSKICNALINAVRNGKKVHVVLELRACFDEEANLEWKTRLEEEGVKVFVGPPDKKVHAKICVIKKQRDHQTELYGFIGTGNLNEKTALSYTDLFLLTSDKEIMRDINRLFTALENPETKWDQLALCKTLLVSPINMREGISKLIDREIQSAKEGFPAKMEINLNSLSDEKLIAKLDEAAAAGVKIYLIIRGVFCVDMNREFMTAISIVDQYLEHSRILLFHDKGCEDIYISSADWMARNLDHRIEVAVKIKDKAIKDELKHILAIKLGDNVKARWLDKELSNQYVSSAGKKRVRSQLAIYNYLKRKGKNRL